MAATKSAKKSEAKDAPAKPKVQRKTQALTVTQAKQIEAQFDTFSKSGSKLAGKLVDIEARFEDKEAYTPQQVAASRTKLVEALATIEESKELFAEIGEKYRSFFG